MWGKTVPIQYRVRRAWKSGAYDNINVDIGLPKSHWRGEDRVWNVIEGGINIRYLELSSTMLPIVGVDLLEIRKDYERNFPIKTKKLEDCHTILELNKFLNSLWLTDPKSEVSW